MKSKFYRRSMRNKVGIKDPCDRCIDRNDLRDWIRMMSKIDNEYDTTAYGIMKGVMRSIVRWFVVFKCPCCIDRLMSDKESDASKSGKDRYRGNVIEYMITDDVIGKDK